MLDTTLVEIRNSRKGNKSAIKFIDNLISFNIPLSAINVNDWDLCFNVYVYITIPYGSKKNSGKTKSFKNRFGNSSLKAGIKFWEQSLN